MARISPDLLRQRALRARAACGLRRWVAEPGVDRWEGTFPSEDAATAWAAIDALAHQYVKDGVCTHIEAARGKALTDLVAGQASIDTVLTITVPATGLTHDPGCGIAAATYVPSVTDAVDGDTRDLVEVIGPAEAATSASDSTAAEGVNEAVSTVFGTAAGTSTGTMAGGGGSDDLVEVTGPAGNQPVFVSRDWVTAMAAPYSRPPSGPRAKAKAASTSTSPPETEPGSGPRSRAVEVAPCHPDTGALIDPANQPAAPGPETAAPAGRTPPALASTLNRIPAGLGAGAYRPTATVAKRVKARDRRCRFPGCSVAAVFCDLDHVRPWPGGPTADTNLICLCRRHHRVKQRPGWTSSSPPTGPSPGPTPPAGSAPPNPPTP